jgi:hypothetical protein
MHATAHARGVSPYLPLELDPRIERDIERVLILADKPVLRRPIAAATVLDALPTACRVDAVLCAAVRRYLDGYMRDAALTHLSAEGAATSGAVRSVPNRYGLSSGSEWAASASGFWQPDDRLLVSAGVVADAEEVTPSGSMLSLGYDFAQLDLGYRTHWLSPFSGSSMLISTQAPTIPSVTLSNYRPLTRFGFDYEFFVGSLSRSDHIQFAGALTSGRPSLAGVHFGIEPATGWALGVNRLMQYGGGDRPHQSFTDLLKALFRPGEKDNAVSTDEQFGNQLGSVNTSFLFPGRTPFSVYFEYAGEDTSRGGSTVFGNASLSAGIHFPRLWQRFDLTLEASEWQNAWYVNSIYLDGLINEGHVIGHWGGDERVFGDGVGAQSGMARLGWDAPFGGVLELQYQTLKNESYGVVPYERGHDFTLRYTYPMRDFDVGAEVFAGRDVFGDSFSRVSAFFRYSGSGRSRPRTSAAVSDDSLTTTASPDDSAEIFVETGAFAYEVRLDPDEATPTVKSGRRIAPHLGIGARRAVSDRSDLGARVELDDLDGELLVALRAIDYRYRFYGPLALNVFVGAAHYNKETPAIGFYAGTGLQWRDVLPGWDAGIDLRFIQNAARDRLLPTDPPGVRPDIFYDVVGASLVITKRF